MTPTQRENAIVECIQVLRPIVKGQSPQEQALEELIGFLPTTAEPAPVQEPVAWLPMDTAPKDGTHVFLQVEFEDHAMEDAPGPHLTIGSNTSENDGGPDEWQFAGWNWEHDCYTQGVGNPVGWLPMTILQLSAQQLAPVQEQQPAPASKPVLLQCLGCERVGTQEQLSASTDCDCWLHTQPAPVQEPVGWSMTYNGSHVGNFYESRSHAEERMTDLNGKHPDALRTVEPLYAAPQAQQPSPPADMPMLTDEELREAFAQSLTSTYVCGRVWGAWGYGTMSEDDFSPASECDELLDSLVQAVRQKAGLK